MRRPNYLSPSAIKMWYDNQEQYYLQYLSDNRPERDPQTQPMSVGSSFDAYVKSHLHKVLFGGTDPQFEFETIFEAQVESQHRDWARKHGGYIFERYIESGALNDLLIELQNASEAPRFEFSVEGRIVHELYKDGITLLGKPDVFFKTKDGMKVIYDWKVNGYCGNYNKSPQKHFVLCRDAYNHMLHKPSNTHNQAHKDAVIKVVSGIPINTAIYFNDVEKDWARQLAIYAWVLGCNVGDADYVVGIDQIVAKPNGEFPLLRVATHRGMMNPEYELTLFKQITDMWDIITSDHIFRDMSIEESQARCAALDSLGEDADLCR